MVVVDAVVLFGDAVRCGAVHVHVAQGGRGKDRGGGEGGVGGEHGGGVRGRKDARNGRMREVSGCSCRESGSFIEFDAGGRVQS